MNKIENFISNNWSTLKLFTIVLALAAVYIAFDNYINNRIDDKIKDKEYIQELSKTLKPFLIFDEEGIITYDHGATIFVDSIKIIYLENKSIDKIIVHLNQFFTSAPLLDHIGSSRYTYTTKRIKNYNWRYDLEYVYSLVLEQSSNPSNGIFILEILQ